MRADEAATWRADFLLARGSDDRRSLSRRAAKGELVRLAPGVYLTRPEWEATSGSRQHVIRMQAEVLQREARLVFSHWSAAVVHGLPLLRPPMRIHVLAERATGGRSDALLQRHCIDIEQPTVVREGLEMTSLATTAAHLAVAAPFAEGVMVADAAVRLAPRELAEVAEQLRGRGAARGRRVLAFADGSAESPGESRSRASIHLAGLTPPVMQVEFHDELGVIRVDFWWPEFGVVGEFDGMVKYLDERYVGDRTAAAVVVEEKRREDRLRRMPEVRTVVRWDYATAGDVVRLGRLLRAAGVR